MSVKIVIKPNTYFDSVSLMSISTRANKLDGVEQAFVAMATEMNKYHDLQHKPPPTMQASAHRARPAHSTPEFLPAGQKSAPDHHGFLNGYRA